MFFRREPPKPQTFEDGLQKVRQAGFAVASEPGGRYRVVRNGIAAVIENAGDHPRVYERPGVIIGAEIASLVDGGFQKFFQTPAGVRKPALAAELNAVHEFQEDVRAALGLPSLYNESLGSVSSLYLYDRVKGRELDRPRKPWELKLRTY